MTNLDEWQDSIWINNHPIINTFFVHIILLADRQQKYFLAIGSLFLDVLRDLDPVGTIVFEWLGKMQVKGKSGIIFKKW